jgi:hypothetical protein
MGLITPGNRGKIVNEILNFYVFKILKYFKLNNSLLKNY